MYMRKQISEEVRVVTFVDIAFGGTVFRGRLLESRSPKTTAEIKKLLPLEGRMIQDEWSAAVARMIEPLRVGDVGDRHAGFEYPGLLALDVATTQLSLCHGSSGRLRGPATIAAVVPVAEVGPLDLTELNRIGDSLQFEGAKPLRLSLSKDQSTPLKDPPDEGRRIHVTLGGARATAVLLEKTSPGTAGAFSARLPMSGFATNTYASGPLTRFWNKDGGQEGETPLEIPANETGQLFLYPGFLYYLPAAPWRGVRICARDATSMGGTLAGGAVGMRLVPFARFAGDWTAFREQAEKLPVEGKKDIRFELA